MSKTIPLRLCLGCREMKPKRELTRAVKSPKGEVSLDFIGTKQGRGAYICHKPECLKKVIKSNAITRTFKMQIPEDIIKDLCTQMENNETTS